MIAIIPGVDVVSTVLAGVALVSLAFVLVYTRDLYRRWRRGARPSMAAWIWLALFASLGTVGAVGIAARQLPNKLWLRIIQEAALLAVLGVLIWIFLYFLRVRHEPDE